MKLANSGVFDTSFIYAYEIELIVTSKNSNTQLLSIYFLNRCREATATRETHILYYLLKFRRILRVK